MEALIFERLGEAHEVLTCAQIAAPTAGPGEVLIAVEASPVHPADFSFVRGRYRVKPVFPQVAGLSGAGRVVSAPAGAGLEPGMRVAFRWPGAWAERIAVPVRRTVRVPDDISIEAASQFMVNPITAFGLLETASVRPGDFIALTAESSSVASLVRALAESRGVRVIGVGRGPAHDPKGTFVDERSPDIAERVRQLTNGAGVSALIDCVGGPLVSSLFPALAPAATIVAYGTLSPEPISVTNATLVYQNLSWLGFGIDRFTESATPEATRAMHQALWQGIRENALPLPVAAREPRRNFCTALGTSERSPGKLLFM